MRRGAFMASQQAHGARWPPGRNRCGGALSLLATGELHYRNCVGSGRRSRHLSLKNPHLLSRADLRRSTLGRFSKGLNALPWHQILTILLGILS